MTIKPFLIRKFPTWEVYLGKVSVTAYRVALKAATVFMGLALFAILIMVGPATTDQNCETFNRCTESANGSFTAFILAVVAVWLIAFILSWLMSWLFIRTFLVWKR